MKNAFFRIGSPRQKFLAMPLARAPPSPNDFGDLSFFQEGGRPPFWICCAPVWTTMWSKQGGLYRCAKFGCNRYSSLDNIDVFGFRGRLYVLLADSLPSFALLACSTGSIGV